jgi:hypothetical protein
MSRVLTESPRSPERSFKFLDLCSRFVVGWAM